MEMEPPELYSEGLFTLHLRRLERSRLWECRSYPSKPPVTVKGITFGIGVAAKDAGTTERRDTALKKRAILPVIETDG